MKSVQEIEIDQLEIGTSQVRVDLASGIDDLAASIRKQGLLQPIVVSRLPNGRYEILAGQRRFLAHKVLGLKTIAALVLDSVSDEDARVAISLTENLVRRDNTQKELIDACTRLYKRYGSVKLVAQETGLSASIVSQYIKYDQLLPELKKEVDQGKLEMKVALQAQRAATDGSGDVDTEAAVKFARELEPMSNVHRKAFVEKVVKSDPEATIEEKIEVARRQPVLRQIIVTLEDAMHAGLKKYADQEALNQDEAAATLIEDGLARRNLLDG